MEKAKLNKLRKQLRGKMMLLARECGVTNVTVSRVLNGEYVNEEIIAKAIEMRNRNQKEKEQRIKKLESLI